MKAYIFPYKSGSESCKALAQELGLLRIAHTNSRFKGDQDKLVINWGSSKITEEVSKCKIINTPEAVKVASNKILAFDKMNEGGRTTRKIVINNTIHDLSLDHEVFAGVPDDFIGNHPTKYGMIVIRERAPQRGHSVRTPPYTTDLKVARSWLLSGETVVERHILNGHSGAGIRLVEPGDGEGLHPCPLYVKYVPKKQEYRIHVCGGTAVDIQRKARRKDVEDGDVNWKIRNHDNGFIFARNEDGVVPNDVIVQSVKAVSSLGLDFGAVDVIFNEKEKRAYVLEVNTAPGLSGSTLEGYVRRFKAMINGEAAPNNWEAPEVKLGVLEKGQPPAIPGILRGHNPKIIHFDAPAYVENAFFAVDEQLV